MRNNQPVTQREVMLADDDFIVTITDPKGVITYANESFVRISGYAEAELVGAPHNIVRHPDMPPEAFADLWTVIRRGFPWSGLVKNRCKNGDFYWVQAGITPIMLDGHISGYVSVRTRPSREAVAFAERLYAEFRGGNPRRLAIHDGGFIRTGLMGLPRRFLSMPFHRRLWITMGAMACMALGIGWLPLLAGRLGLDPTLAVWVSAIASVGLAAACAAVVLYLDNRVGKPLQRAIRVAQAIAGGDVSKRFDPRHGGDLTRFLSSLNLMNSKLTAVLIEVRRNVGGISDAVGQLAQGTIDLSGRTERQAESVRDTAQATGELTESVQANVRSIQEATSLAGRATAQGREGMAMATQAIETMEQIGAASHQVGDITGLIDSIAFQTNILALNASVEAARAGQQGRGFAVVASEVRALAERSAAAARDIKGLIENTRVRVEQGTDIVRDTGRKIDDIVGRIDELSAIVARINSTTGSQSDGVSHINEAVGALEGVTQQNAALVEESSAAAAMLREQVRQLSDAIAVFRFSQGRK